jgi:threonylcarbamoyladenosine tRNA methylthiotransferase MtaB
VETQAAGRESQASDLQSLRLRTRAFVKIQDGCNLACSYCIIPVARGKERSRTRDEIVKDIAALVDAGYKEIVLTGVQISAYRNGEADSRFALRDLVAAILAETNVPRLRLTSIAPWDVDESLLDLWHDARLCRHLHLSLQSGSDPVLHRMKRLYTTAQFARAVESVRAKIPDVGITTDVIVGFPGEDEIEFGQSSKFVERMQFSRVHVFSYSKRTGTSAAALPAQVAEPVKQARAQQMQAIADASLRAFAQRFVGRELTVLWETREDRKGAGERRSEAENSSLLPCAPVPLRYWSGYSDNYIRVVAASDADLTNQFTSARVIEVAGEGVLALL